MTTGRRLFFFGLALLGAVTAEEMLRFLPTAVAHALAFMLLWVAFSFLIEGTRLVRPGTTVPPWYLVAPVAFLIMLAPPWVAGALLGGSLGWVLLQGYRRKRRA